MAKLTIPLATVQKGGAFEDWYYNNCLLRSGQVILETDDTNAYAVDTFNLNETQLLALLSNSGDIEEYLMGIHAPYSLLNQDVPVGLPNRLAFDNTVKKFKNWIVKGAEIWIKDDNSEICFYTNPFALNQNNYLKGSEIELIKNIAPGQIDILRISEVQILVETGWTKV
jgi:hypothetical protein